MAVVLQDYYSLWVITGIDFSRSGELFGISEKPCFNCALHFNNCLIVEI